MDNNNPKYSRTNGPKKNGRLKRNKQSQSSSKSKRSLWSKILLSLIAALVLAITVGALTFFAYARSAPKLSEQQLESAGSTVIYDSNGKKLMSLGTENRTYVSEKNIPTQLKDAVVSIEDRRFYQHHGVDPWRIVAAAMSNASSSSAGLQGGSTLDQQLIKLSYFSTKRSDQTLKRKAQEAWLALQLDRQYSKDQILTFYVNKVFMGDGCYGMQTAAKYYFGKTLDQLDLAQTALIAGISNAPSSYNPYSSPELATKRRNEVLDAMVANKKISQTQANEAKNENVTTGLVEKSSTKTTTTTEKIADPYIKQVIQEARQKGYDPYKDSLQIYTNLDMSVQKRLYEIANTDEYLNFPDDQLQVATTVIDPNNGNVVAMLGGRKTGDVTFGLNRAVQTDRTNGSTAKPLLDYAPAIEYLDWATYHMLKDTSYVYPGTNIQLYDFDHQYKGNMTMRQALIESRNVPAIRALSAVGITKAQNFISKMGFDYKKTLEYQNGIGLPSSTLQNAAAYAAFANGGTYYEPQYIKEIVTGDGERKEFSSTGKQVMQSSTAYMITDMLKGVLTSPEGTGTRANIAGLYQAGKTGTNAYPSDIADKFPSNAAMDSWFNGYTKNYSISVWVGYDHQYEAGNYLDSNSIALASLLYKDIMTYVSQGRSNTDWKRPSNVYTRYINGVRELYLAGSAAPSSSLVDKASSTSRSSTSSASSSETSQTSSSTSESSTHSSETSSSSTSNESENQSSTSSQSSNESSSASSTSSVEPSSSSSAQSNQSSQNQNNGGNEQPQNQTPPANP